MPNKKARELRDLRKKADMTTSEDPAIRARNASPDARPAPATPARPSRSDMAGNYTGPRAGRPRAAAAETVDAADRRC